MKTVKELAQQYNMHRTTLNKAIERGDVPARKSGATWLIDEESDRFKQWLAGSRMGRPRKHASSSKAALP